MNEYYEALEECLRALDQGSDLKTALELHPHLAHELRPVLEASLAARRLRPESPAADVQRRARARLLSRAAEMRAARRPVRRPVIPWMQRLALALTLTAVFLLSGTGLVNAASNALPGESLYPVKRTWEDVRLRFIVAPHQREAVEGEYEQERLKEVLEIIRKGRTASILFSGVVTGQQDQRLVVSGVTVEISSQTSTSGTALTIGSAVLVQGRTGSQGLVLADSIQGLPPGSLVPAGSNEQDVPSGAADDDEQRRTFHFEGTVESIQGNIWTVNGRMVYVEDLAIDGTLSPGTYVEVEGYFAQDGRFIAASIEVEDSGADDEDRSGRDGEGHEGDDEENGDDQDDGGEEDDEGGGDDSGSGSDGGSDSGGSDDPDWGGGSGGETMTE